MIKKILALLFFLIFLSPSSVLAACPSPFGNKACGKPTYTNPAGQWLWIFNASWMTDGGYGDGALDYDFHPKFVAGATTTTAQIDLGASYPISRVRFYPALNLTNVCSGGIHPRLSVGLSPNSSYWTGTTWNSIDGYYQLTNSVPYDVNFSPAVNAQWISIMSDCWTQAWWEVEAYCVAAQTCSTCHTNTYTVPDGNCGTTTCAPNAPVAQSCPTSCHTDTQTVPNGACGSTSCPPNAPTAQSCPTTCHTDTQYVSNGACGYTTCPPNPSAAQSCPTTCHASVVTVPNGACGTTSCPANAPAAQSCPTACHTTTTTVPNGNCGTTSCPANAPAAQSCPTACHTDTQTVPNGSCGNTSCPPNAPAAQSCPTTCHTNTQYVPNGACGLTTCPSNAPASQSCPTTCHTDTQTIPNGACGTNTCPSNAPPDVTCNATCGYAGGYVGSGTCTAKWCPAIPPTPAQSCPTACHTNTQYVPNGTCGGFTTCPPNAPTAQSCPTTCHTNTQTLPNGTCGNITCPPNAPAAQSCPTACHTDTQTVPNGSCGTTSCPANPPPAQTCPTVCHTTTLTVPNGSCGTTSCPSNPIPPQECPQSCGYSGGYVSDGTCGTYKFTNDPTNTLSNNLVSYWKLDETSGTSAYDTLGNNNGTINNATSTTGKLNNARNFNSTTAFINFGNNSSVNYSGSTFSFGGWFYPTSNAGTIIHKHNQYSLALTGGKLTYADSSNWCYSCFGSFGTINLNAWNHAFAVRNGTNVKLYLNGTQIASKTFGGAISTSSNNLAIGCYFGSSSCSSSNFTGSIDEIGIWNKALTATEVTNLYNSGGANALSYRQNTPCPAITPVPEQDCPTACHTDTVYVSDGTCYGSKACPPNPPAYQACPDFCGYEGGTVPDGSCGTITCLPKCCPTAPVCTGPIVACSGSSCGGSEIWSCTDGCSPAYPDYRPCSIGSAGIIQTNSSSINTGSGKISQNGEAPGFNLTGYTARTNILDNINYSTFLCLILKNTGLACQTPILTQQLDNLFTTNAGMYPADANPAIAIGTNYFRFWRVSSSDFNSVLDTIIARNEPNTIHIMVPSPASSSKSQTISTGKTLGNKRVLAFVNGSLNIQANIATIHGDSTSSIVFILNNLSDGLNLGNITVASTVSALDGVYVFPGSFDDEVGSQLIGYGSLINTGPGPINFRRSFLSGPAEQWFYEPKYLNIYSTILAAPTYKWSELTPQ